MLWSLFSDTWSNGVARIFFLGGATRYIFVTSPGTDRIQWGDIFSDLNYRIGFSGGGGVVAEIVPVSKSITFPRFRCHGPEVVPCQE